MENTFENAMSYIAQLKEINPTVLLDDKVLACAFMSYSAKTSRPTKELLQNFAEKYRQWQRQWDLFDRRGGSEIPKDLDELIDELLGVCGTPKQHSYMKQSWNKKM